MRRSGLLTRLAQVNLCPLLFVFLAAVPVVVYYCLVIGLQRNLPIFDDYILELDMVRLREATTWTDKIQLLFSQLNEHRLVYVRGWFWLVYWLHGQISFSALIIIGNLALLGLGWLLVRLLWQLSVPIVVWVPVCWLLFQMHFYENSLWAMASLQNITVHLFYALLFVLVVNPERRSWWGAWAVAALLCYTSGNGFIAVVLAGIALLVQRRWRDAGAWLILLTVLMSTYFWGYERPAILSGVDTYSLLDKLSGAMIFLGAYFNIYPFTDTYQENLLVGGVVCVGVAGMSVWLINRLFRVDSATRLTVVYRASLVTLLLASFLVLSAGAVANNRLSFAGWRGLMLSRYSLYSTMFVITGYIQFVLIARERGWPLRLVGGSVLAASIIFWIGIFQHHLAGMYNFRSRSLAFYYNFRQTQSEEIKQQVATVFQPVGADRRLLAQLERKVAKPWQNYPNGDQLISAFAEGNDEVTIKNSWFHSSLQPDNWVWVLLKGDDHTLLFPSRRATNLGLRSFWLQQTWFGNGFETQVYRSFTRKQPYHVGLIQKNKQEIRVYRTSRVL
ncbi:hypothetical protein [Spirosoma sp. KUDC1026]|uniref:hypothetical protein n=1 Tax=Spirosoma sp. KUDC1026 TaxID=2745947 RepID=UPI00159BB080|nr:hypothetical protein [Spirosoma sp. KUDC1026]QKZ15419.1 hypothetical protein HU175_23490 [Spirosoma sp. KUDC1026]